MVTILIQFALAALVAGADPGLDTVHLQNGGRLRGVVMEEDPRVGVTIRLPTGEVRKLASAEVLRVDYQDGPIEGLDAAPPPSPPAHLGDDPAILGIKGVPGYGVAGCGLGAMIFHEEPGINQVLASTSNTSFYSQTFGISTGTSNCGFGTIDTGTRHFVEANREALAKDLSRGQGETIGALTWMAGCSSSRAVGAALQRRYTTIFPSEKTSSQEITDKLLETLKTDESLGCRI